MSGPLALIRDRLIADLKVALPEITDAGSHPGRLAPKDVERISAVSPALRCGIFGPVRTAFLPTGEIIARPRFAAVFVVRTFDLLESNDLAMDLAVRAAAFVASWLPGEADEERAAILGCGLPEEISAEPAPGLDEQGIALWGCLFTVPLRTGAELEDERIRIGDVEGAGPDWRDAAGGFQL